MDTTRTERIRLGIFLLICLGAAVGFTVFIAQQQLSNQKTRYYTVFSESVIGLSVDAKVMLNGIEVGNVAKIYIDSTDLGNVVVEFDVQSGTPIKTGTRAQMTNGISLTGKKDLVLSGGQVTEPDVPEGGKVLAGTNVFTKISGKAESTVENLNEIFDKLSKILSEENATHIENTLRNLERASANTSKLTQNAERPLREIEASAASLHKILGDVEKAELAQKLEKVLLLVQAKIQEIDTKSINEDLVSTIASIRSFTERTDLFLYNTQSDVSEILNRLNAVLSNLSEFSQKIRQNPSALIRSEKKSGR